ncbi:Anaerobic nitric oxide reductase transcription regulator NorR [Neobacillus rhizosphaerae]|uniref:Anaerobic nitric oxide reductase transcription regulator NorR n=1 Tax=Neobacillus rhizosphaerae TaxID=2880965 RepID=A0ABN8KRF3_9BACI|nr:sigma 54-interacting transcriptional regulator [Neobacillus rhizosphaerae]CAH2715017.1 Anaerobic nitric oxide reductase transcription regulator NorR [Neobacillus rhizosphaerae]
MPSIMSITKVIHTFAELLEIEIAFFNHEGILTATTEEYMKKKGNRVHLAFFQKLPYEHPVKFVHKPGHMNMCQGCHFQNKCPSTAEIVQNISVNGNNYGYLSFVSFTQDGQEKLITRQKEYNYWILKLTEIISSILHEKEGVPRMKKKREKTDYILGNSLSMQKIRELIKNLKNSTSSIVITGETGTGKSLLAKLIHEQSMIQKGDFVEINCASIPESLFESELFGYEEGAFTGARKRGKPGYFEMADRGTLFLDEIADLPIHLQPKLLKVLQDGLVQRIGGTLPKQINVRIIAAANQSLEKLMALKQFRSDLYYRLNVIPLHLTPLRERKEDIEELLSFLLEKLQIRTGKFIQTYSKGFLKRIKEYHWPGNIRELENVIEYCMSMEKSTQLTESSLPDFLVRESKTMVHDPHKEHGGLKEVEKALIIQKLHLYGYDHDGKKQVAQELGVSMRTLNRKIDKYTITFP